MQDDVGNYAIASMIHTMPQVVCGDSRVYACPPAASNMSISSQALQALDQLHKIVSARRKQYYLLSHLEPEPGANHNKGVKTPVSSNN